MTNRDRDSVATLLRKLSDRLSEAPAVTSERAQKGADESGVAGERREGFVLVYQVSGLGHVCADAATEIRSLVDEYLTPRTSKVRGKR